VKAVLDSCAWIELLTAGPNAPAYQKALAQAKALLVPVLCVYELHRWLGAKADEAQADSFIQSLQAHTVLPVDANLAVEAARLGRRHRLALADSLIYASARGADAILWTQDAAFDGLPGVRYLPKPKA
jgi:predicted nucleic acid-binding protein